MNINNNNTAHKPSVTTRIREVLAQFILGKNHPGHLPHIPQPGQALPDPLAGISTDFSEAKVHLRQIGNTSITFGTIEGISVDDEGNCKEIVQEPSYRIGSGYIVSDITQIAGICSICELASLEMYQAGLITLQEANLRAMYDHHSAAQCDICGQHFCSAHCRPIRIENEVTNLCVLCLKTMQKKERRRRILSWLFAPLTESMPHNKEENPR